MKLLFISRYLFECEIYETKMEKGEIDVFCFYRIGTDMMEIKNIAVAVQTQLYRIGSYMMMKMGKIILSEDYKTVVVGTGDCDVH